MKKQQQSEHEESAKNCLQVSVFSFHSHQKKNET